MIIFWKKIQLLKPILFIATYARRMWIAPVNIADSVINASSVSIIIASKFHSKFVTNDTSRSGRIIACHRYDLDLGFFNNQEYALIVYCDVLYCIAISLTGLSIPTNWFCLFHPICIILHPPLRMYTSFFLSFYNHDHYESSYLPFWFNPFYHTADGWIHVWVPKITGW